MLTMADGLARARHTHAPSPALLCGDHVINHASLAERCERVVTMLGGLGLGRGDRVAVLAANCHRYAEAYLGVPSAGLVLVPLNTRLSAAEIAGILQDCAARVLVTDRDPGALVGEVEQVMTFDDWDARRDAAEPGELGKGVHEDDLALLYYTGGTTGRPKGVMLTHRNVVANSFHKSLACGFTDADRFLAAGPFFHVAGTAPVLGLIWLGGSLVMLPAFDPSASLDAVERMGVTVAIPVPTMLAALVDEQRARPRDVASLRMLGHAGSAITTDLLVRAHEAFPSAELAQFYGATETASIVTCMHHEERLLGTDVLGSCGQPVVGVTVKIVDPDGIVVGPRSIGEVLVSGPNVTIGYWNNPRASAEALADGWYRTGDLGYLDEAHRLSLVDRAKDMIVSGGENVYSIEVEDVLARHPAVAEVAVFGVPDDRWIEAVHAVVVVREGYDTDGLVDALQVHCRAFIAGYKIPKAIDLRSDPLPKSGPGKVLKRALRDPFWAQHATHLA
jgi:long-chain acyl-CoA synthetase